MRILVINDPHTADRPPRKRTESYTDDIFAKLRIAFGLVDSYGCAAILIPGDLFHTPQATKVSHQLVSRWLALIESVSVPVYAVAGNHDLAAGRIEGVGRQPIYSLAQHPRFHLLEKGEVVKISGSGTYATEAVTLCGIHWTPDYDTLKHFLPTWPKPDILMCHAPLEPKLSYPGSIAPENLEGAARGVVYGHIHLPWVEKFKRTWFVNPGALARCTLSDEDAYREVGVAILSVTSDLFEVSIHTIPARSPEEIFRIAQTESVVSVDQEIASFVESLRTATLHRITVEDLMETIHQLTPDPEVRELARMILSDVSGQ